MVSPPGVVMPTRFRPLSDHEWKIVDTVFGDTLPYRWRVYLSDGVGLQGRAFTVPTSAITSALGLAAFANPLGAGGPIAAAPRIALGTMFGELASATNLGYVINMGPDYYYRGCGVDNRGKYTLVHEMTHVWQAKNGIFALSATLASLAAQCKGAVVTGSLAGTSKAYDYTIATPPQPWGSFNPEQQANIVENYYVKRFLWPTPTLEEEWPYVRDSVREGKVR